MSMDDQQQPELSLGSCRSNLSPSSEAKNSSSDSDFNASAPAPPPANNPSRKRKPSGWDTLDDPNLINHATIDLQLYHHPLPVDWEQCLDLQSGRIYYLNRKSLKRSWMRPTEEKLDLELNISSAFPPPDENKVSDPDEEDAKMPASTGNMVAAVCVNCHLLVMLCKSSPSCPNCKCNSLPPLPPSMMTTTTTSDKLETVKSLKTLSLLH